MLYDEYLQLYHEGKLYSRFLKFVQILLCSCMPLVMHHVMHHSKAYINYV
jgi:hypothetical protein